MRALGRHIDPRINIFDMANDAVQYAADRFELLGHSAAKLKDNLSSLAMMVAEELDNLLLI